MYAIKITKGSDKNGNTTLTASFKGKRIKETRYFSYSEFDQMFVLCERIRDKLNEECDGYIYLLKLHSDEGVFQHSDTEYFACIEAKSSKFEN